MTTIPGRAAAGAATLLLAATLAGARYARSSAAPPAPTAVPTRAAALLARAAAQGGLPGPAAAGRRATADRSARGPLLRDADATHGVQVEVSDLGHAWLFHAGPYVPVDELSFLTDPRRLGRVELRVATPAATTVHELEPMGDSHFALVPRAALPAGVPLALTLTFWDDRADPSDPAQAFLVLVSELTLR